MLFRYLLLRSPLCCQPTNLTEFVLKYFSKASKAGSEVSASSSSESSSSSSSESDSEEEKSKKKKKKKKEKKSKKDKSKKKEDVEEEIKGILHPLANDLTKIDPGEIPDVPANKFLSRGSDRDDDRKKDKVSFTDLRFWKRIKQKA